MSTKRFEIERITVTSSKPFEAVMAALKAGVGRPDLVELAKASRSASTFADVEKVINRDLGRTGLMLFLSLIMAQLSGKKRVKTHLE